MGPALSKAPVPVSQGTEVTKVTDYVLCYVMATKMKNWISLHSKCYATFLVTCMLFVFFRLASFTYGAFPLHGTVRFGMARYGTAQFGSVCISTAV